MNPELQEFSDALDAVLMPLTAQIAATQAGVMAALRAHANSGVDVMPLLNSCAESAFRDISSMRVLTDRQRDVLQGAFDQHLSLMQKAVLPPR